MLQQGLMQKQDAMLLPGSCLFFRTWWKKCWFQFYFNNLYFQFCRSGMFYDLLDLLYHLKIVSVFNVLQEEFFLALILKIECSFMSPNVGRTVSILPFRWLFFILNVNVKKCVLGYKCPETLANTASVPEVLPTWNHTWL